MDVPLDLPPARDLTVLTVFSDLTTVPYVGYTAMTADRPAFITFNGTLTDTEAKQCRFRATHTDIQEQLFNRARQLRTDLRSIRDSSGTLTTAQLSNAVRTLAQTQLGVINLLLDDGTLN